MNSDKKKMISIIVTIVIGIVLGFFGVMVSVFSDGSTYERIITILIILIIYGVLSLIIGFIRPVKPWGHMLSLSLPGVIMLGFYSIKEFNALYIVYIALILLMTYFGTKSGKSMKRKKNWINLIYWTLSNSYTNIIFLCLHTIKRAYIYE